LGEPQRGDVITFESPKDGVRLIKRLVGVPGDVVELKHDRLLVNGVAADYGSASEVTESLNDYTVQAVRTTERIGNRAHAVQWLPGVPARRDFGPIVVPPDSYFFLGDNRDNSADSRYIGIVPRDLLIGRAHRILVSADITRHWQLRGDRFGKPIE